jgi:hypothetical protein
VVAYFEPHGRKDSMALVECSLLEEMDTDAVLRRHPQIAVVDEFPHTNVPGSPRARRWEDVRVLLDAGIDVLTTMNVQHVENLNDQIWQSTGVRVRETVPDWVVKQADEVVMVDLTRRGPCSTGWNVVSFARPNARAPRCRTSSESRLWLPARTGHASNGVLDREPTASGRIRSRHASGIDVNGGTG